MLTAVLAAVAVATSGAQNAPSAPSAGAAVVTVTDQKLSDPTINASIQSIQVEQSHPQPGLDVHIRPIDPAGDLMLKLFSA